ncbi:MAG: hypothetical protein ACM3NQ_03690 [Bacteroidales bacterium]
MRRMVPVVLIVALAAVCAASLWARQGDQDDVLLKAAMKKETVDGDLRGAILQYQALAKSANRVVAAQALVRLGLCYRKQGNADAARAWQRVVRDFADQKNAVAEARQFLSADAAAGPSHVVATQLAQLGDRLLGPAISRDGRYIAFTNQGREIGILDVTTGEQRRVLTRPDENVNFGWALISPDGATIAYLATKPGAGTEVRIVGIEGLNAHPLPGQAAGTNVPLSWAPDGKSLLMGTSEDGVSVRAELRSIANGDSRVIASGVTAGRISPDGRYVAFTKLTADGNETGIVVVPSAGGREVEVLHAPFSDPLWAPDGKHLLAIKSANNRNELWSVPMAEGSPAGTPSFVQNEVSALVAASARGECYVTTRSSAKDLYVARIDPQAGKVTTPPSQITTGLRSSGGAWSPDGQSLAYYATRTTVDSSKLAIIVRSSQTGEEREVPLKEPLNVPSMRPQWFPDSRSLFLHWDDGRLRRLDVNTGELTPLLDGAKIPPYRDDNPFPFYFRYVLLAPDGRTIYYLARDASAKQTRILKRTVDGGPQLEVARINVIRIPGISISPDGTRLVYSSPDASKGNHGSLWTIPTSGGEPKEIYRSSTRHLYDPIWSPDGRHVLFFADYANGDIGVVPADGGEARMLGVVMTMKYYLAVHPDGNQLAFVDEIYNNHLWVLKNLFPEQRTSR